MHFSSLLSAGLLAAVAVAHPGHDHHAEMAERRAMLQHSRRDLSHCAEKLKARGIEARNVQRRAQMAASLMKKRGLKNRDLTTLLNTSHHSSEDYTLDTPETTLFASNGSCVLSPEVTEGPYCA